MIVDHAIRGMDIFLIKKRIHPKNKKTLMFAYYDHAIEHEYFKPEDCKKKYKDIVYFLQTRELTTHDNLRFKQFGTWVHRHGENYRRLILKDNSNAKRTA